MSETPVREHHTSRTIVDIDDQLLAEAAELLGTGTKKATVNAALAEIVNREKRRAFASWVKSGGMTEESTAA